MIQVIVIKQIMQIVSREHRRYEIHDFIFFKSDQVKEHIKIDFDLAPYFDLLESTIILAGITWTSSFFARTSAKWTRYNIVPF